MNDMQSRAMFRKALNNLIRKTGISRVALASLSGVSVSQLNRWTEGNLMPTWKQFNRLTEIFGVDDEKFLGTSVSERSYESRFK